ncbi:MAG TPA: glycosyltransferase family 39 protein [Flavobacterium sp.]|nr:glycosyltransferase family 39 protein [Flavobacterium sp.]
MTRNFLAIIGHRRLLQISFAIFVLVYAVLIVLRFLDKPFVVDNNDHYKELFTDFLHQGFYQSSVSGTSALYNFVLAATYQFTQSVDGAFLIVNAVCDLFYLVFGWYFLKSLAPVNTAYAHMVFGVYALYIINQQSYLHASNDTFLGVFVLGLLYVGLVRFKSPSLKDFAAMGLLLGLAFGTRITAVYLIPPVAILIWHWWRQNSLEPKYKIAKVGFMALIFVITTLLFHYPSLIEKQKLGYESKEPKSGATWIQRNYLGLKKVEQGKEALHRDAIWQHTKFDVVDAYLNANGADSLPRTFIQAVVKDPLLAMEIGLYNCLAVLGRFLRFWGLLLLLPLIVFFRKGSNRLTKLPIILFFVFAVMLSFTCYTFIEFRWFSGYEILVPASILLSIGHDYMTVTPLKNALFTLSLMLVTVFNLKSILGS